MQARPEGPRCIPALKLRLLEGVDRTEPGSLQFAPPSRQRIAAYHRRGFVLLEAKEVWAFQAGGDRTFVHCPQGKFEVDPSLVEIEESFCHPLMRVHRSWLVNLSQVRAFEREETATMLFVGSRLWTEGDGVYVPVSRDLAQSVRNALLANTTGLREGTKTVRNP
jgi:two-component system response regulator LytT